MNERIGFVGLGIMGQGMTRNLLKAGYNVRVWNRTASRMDPLVEAGATAAASPADVAANCDIVIICVSDTPDVQAVVLDENGILSGANQGSLVIDCSTISPQATIEIAAQLNAKGVKMLDAPVSGGSEGAANGTLSIMIGGDEDQVERARGVFEAMGNTITHVGKQGAGQTVKLVNQILVVGNCLAMSEALIFAQAGGVDLQKCLNAVSGGAAGSWMLANRGPQIIERDWRPASPSTCNKRTCASSCRKPTPSASPSCSPARSSASIAPSKKWGSAKKATTPSSRRSKISAVYRSPELKSACPQTAFLGIIGVSLSNRSQSIGLDSVDSWKSMFIM